MGMSSSQARLLNLTARMHQIEYKAAKLEAQKLQMANESAHVYNEYLNALEATKLQGFTLNADGSMSAKNLTLSIIEGLSGESIAKSLYLTDPETGKMYITNAMKTKYNLDGSGEVGDEVTFMHTAGFESAILRYDTVANTAPTITYTASDNYVGATTVARQVPVTPPTAGYLDVEFPSIPEGAIAISSINATDNFEVGKTYTISNADDLDQLRLMVNTNNKTTQGVNFMLTSDIYLTGKTWDGYQRSGCDRTRCMRRRKNAW